MTPRTTLIRNGRPPKTASTPSNSWWSSPPRRSPLTRLRRRLRLEPLETRQLLDGAPWQNPVNRFDVDGDHLVMPADVLAMVNDINARQSRELPDPSAQAGPPPYLDVNGDNWITPADVLDCINFINYLWQEGVPPIVTVGSLLTSHAQPTLSGTVTDPWPTRGITGVQVTVAGQTLAATISGSTWSAAVPLPLADGVYDVTAQATDWAGNVGSDTTSDELVVDTEIPTVTVNQAAGQLDPSQTSPVYFTVVFSEAVFGFGAEDVTLTGTAPGAPGAMVTPVGSDGRTYTVAVGGMTGSGTVVAGVPAGAAHDAAGNGNAASTSTDNVVTCNFPPLFEDEELEQAVRQALGLPAGEYVDRDDVLTLTALSLDSNTIESLQGLQYLENLRTLSLQPADWTAPAGELSVADPLAPLAGLTQLETLTLARVGLSGGELASLTGAVGLRSLDVRYNTISTVPDLSGFSELRSLSLYGNPLADTSSLAGRVLQTDLAPGDVNQARTVAELAAALHHLPLAIYEHVVNQFEYQPYPGSMKGPQAVLETRAGNDWDQAGLLMALLAESGVTSRYVSGRIEADAPLVLDWLGVTHADAALRVLAAAGLSPVLTSDAHGNPETFRFDHVWVEAWLDVPGSSPQWAALDGSWKFRVFQPGVPGLLRAAPFDESGYLSQVRSETAAEYYAQTVSQYLAAHFGDKSLADVAYDGPIRPMTVAGLPSGLPYTVDGTPDVYSDVPLPLTHRVRLVVQQAGTCLIDQLLVLPEMGQERVTIGFAPDGDPLLRLDGNLQARGDALSSSGYVQIDLYHYDPGDDEWDVMRSYTRAIGDWIAVGLDANQISHAMLQRQQETVNEASVAALNGGAVDQESQVGALLALGILSYFHETNAGEELVDALTQAAPVYARVASGLATSEATVTLHPDLMIPAVPRGVIVDVANGYHQSFSIDGDTSVEAARERIINLDGSAQEHAVWERLVNTESMSTVKSLQLAAERGIPVFTIDADNAATYVPQLTLAPSTKAAIQAEVNAGAKVTVPRDPTPLNDWQGVGYITERAGGSAFIISGGLSFQAVSECQGGSGTGEPSAPNPPPPGNPDPNQTKAGDPVNVANGNVTRDESEIRIPGTGLPLDFARHYDSQSDLDVGLGVGWLHTYSHFLSFQPDGTVIWTDDQGHRFAFAPDGSGGYLSPATLHGVLTATAGGYRYRERDGRIHEFDEGGKLVEIRDRYGNALTLSYDDGHLAAVADADAPSRRLTFAYSGEHLTAVSDFTGRTWSYAYAGPHLALATSPSDANTPAAVVQYSYYPDSDAILGGLLQQITEPDGGRRTFTYYANRRARRVTDPQGFTETLEYDLFRRRTVYLDQRGFATVYDYDASGYLTQLTHPTGARESCAWEGAQMVSWTDPAGNSETYEYDAQGNLTRLTDRAGAVTQFSYEPDYGNLTRLIRPGGRITVNEYDANGNLIGITDALGNVTTMTYDAHGLLLTHTRPKGNLTPASGDYTTSYAYNDAGQVTSTSSDLPMTVSYGYDPVGNLISRTDANGNTTTLAYDIRGRLTGATGPLGNQRQFAYDAAGNLRSATDPLGRTTTFEYDFLQRRVRTVYADGTSQTVAYDASGNVTMTADELGHVMRYAFDPLNRRIAVQYPDGGTQTMAYDAAGWMIRSTDARGYSTTYTYDPLGRRLSATDAQGHTATRTYDEAGNLLSATDPLGHTTSYQYDLLDRLIRIVDPLQQPTVYTYDPNGNLETVTDPLGRTVTFGYDVADRMVSQTDASHAATLTGYDASGNVISVTDPLGHQKWYGYDELNRLTSVSDHLGGVTARQYDLVGNVVSLMDPAGNKTAYAYDARDRVVVETDPLGQARTYAYDPAGNLLAATDRNGRVRRFAYDASDRQVSEVWLDEQGQTVESLARSYDAVGRVTQVSSAAAAYAYTYDEVGRLVSIAGDVTGLEFVQSKTETHAGRLEAGDSVLDGEYYVDVYTFDAQAGTDLRLSLTSGALDSFLWLRSPSGASWSDDDSGEGLDALLEATADVTGTYTVYATSALPWETGEYQLDITTTGARLGPLVLNYAYDGAGNVKSVRDSLGGVKQYAHDERDYVVQITQSGGTSDKRVDFGYDAARQMTGIERHSDLAGSQLVAQTTYTYDANVAGRLIGLTHARGPATLAAYTWTFDDAGRIVQMTSPDGTADFTYDATNQLQAADHTQQQDESYTYDANGNRTLAGYVTGANNRLLSEGTYQYAYDAEGNLVRRTELATGAVRRLTWDHRNRLIEVTDEEPGGTPVQRVRYTYDAFDRRIAASVDGDPQDGVEPPQQFFVYDGDDVLLELRDADGTAGPQVAQPLMRYLHGPAVDQVLAQESETGGTQWLLGDHLGTIRDIVDGAGTVLNHVSYDSFGNITNQTAPAVASRYAFTGREYGADVDLYYCRARYYDAATGRFVSEDPITFSSGDANLYRYVLNDPVRLVDPSGHKPPTPNPSPGPTPTAPLTEAETLSQARDQIANSEFAKTKEGKKVLDKIDKLLKDGNVEFDSMGSHRGEWSGSKIRVSDNYINNVDATASELVHEATHGLNEDEHPAAKTKNTIDEEYRTNKNQVDFYNEQKENGFRDPELDRRLESQNNGKLREDIKNRYPELPDSL